MAKYDQINSVIGEGSVFEGKFYISGSLKVDGKFEGEIKTEDILIIGPSGRVKTNITAKEVVMSGALIGDITAIERVRLTESGRMLGNITTPSIHISEGVVYNGSINITGGLKNEPKKLVQEYFAVKSKDKEK